MSDNQHSAGLSTDTKVGMRAVFQKSNIPATESTVLGDEDPFPDSCSDENKEWMCSKPKIDTSGNKNLIEVNASTKKDPDD